MIVKTAQKPEFMSYKIKICSNCGKETNHAVYKVKRPIFDKEKWVCQVCGKEAEQ